MLDKAAAMLVHFFCLKCIAGCWYCKINALEPKVINHFRYFLKTFCYFPLPKRREITPRDLNMTYSVQTQLWPFKFCKFISSVLAISKQCPCPYLKTHWRSSQLKRTKFGPLMVSFTRCKLFRVVSLCVYKQHVLYVPFPLLEVKS